MITVFASLAVRVRSSHEHITVSKLGSRVPVGLAVAARRRFSSFFGSFDAV